MQDAATQKLRFCSIKKEFSGFAPPSEEHHPLCNQRDFERMDSAMKTDVVKQEDEKKQPGLRGGSRTQPASTLNCCSHYFARRSDDDEGADEDDDSLPIAASAPPHSTQSQQLSHSGSPSEYKAEAHRVHIKQERNKRQRYLMLPEDMKQLAVNCARDQGPKYSSEYYGVPIKSLKRWMKLGVTRKKGGGRKTKDPDMEHKLEHWCKELTRKGEPVTAKMIKDKAMNLSTCSGFIASKGWLDKFKTRHNLEIHKEHSGSLTKLGSKRDGSPLRDSSCGVQRLDQKRVSSSDFRRRTFDSGESKKQFNIQVASH